MTDTAPDGQDRTLPDPGATPLGSAGLAIGPYKLLEKIGEGGFGEVWSAEQKEPVRRRVALKIIKLGMDTRQVVARFEAERQALALMDHPNIAKVLDAGATSLGRPFFVMELVKGIPITDYCERNAIPLPERLGLLIQVCRAIQHAHQKGIIHRDIKPSNILVAMQDGVAVPKVIDFGIAKATQQELTEKTLYTQLNQFIGTPAYMSPEQAEMTGIDIDTRSDIYSLGVLLYELLTGATPFDTRELLSAGLEGMRRMIREREPVRPSTRVSTRAAAGNPNPDGPALRSPQGLRSVIDSDLDWIAMKCLEKDRTRRYETANGLALDLERYRNSEAILARPPDLRYRFRKWARRNQVGVAAGLAISASLVCGLFLSIRGLRRERAARANETLQRQLAEENGRKAASGEQRMRRILYASQINLAQQALELSNFGRARELLEQTRPRPGETDLRGWEWRYVWQQARPTPHERLALFSSPVLSLAISPDGVFAAILLLDRHFEIWDLRSRKQLKRLPAFVFARNAVAWSPDGRKLAICTGTDGLLVYRTDTWEILARAPGEDRLSIAFSPDSLTLACTRIAREGGVLETIAADSGAILAKADLPGNTLFGAHFLPIRFSPDGNTVVAGGANGLILLWNRSSGWRQIGGGTLDSVAALAFLDNGRKIAAGSGYSDSSIRIWDVATGALERILTGHNGWITSLRASPDGQLLYSACADQTIRVWNTASWESTARLAGHSDEIWALGVLPDSRTILTGGKNGELFLWNHRSSPPSPAPEIPFPALSYASGTLVPIDPATGEPSGAPLIQLGTNIIGATRNLRRGLILTLSQTGVLGIWDQRDFHPVAQTTAEGGTAVFQIGANQDRIFVQQGSSGGTLFDFRGQRIRAFPSGPTNPPIIHFRPVHDRFIRLTAAGRLEVVSPEGPSRFLELGVYSTGVFSAEHPQNPWIAIASESGHTSVVDLEAPRLLYQFRGGAFHAVRFSPDGQRLVTFSGGRESLKFWDLETGQELITIPGPDTVYKGPQFSEDGAEIVAYPHGNLANPVRWRAPSWEEIGETSRQTP